MRSNFFLAVGLAVAMVATVLCSSLHAQTLQKVRVTIPVPVFTFFPLYFDRKTDFSPRKGLTSRSSQPMAMDPTWTRSLPEVFNSQPPHPIAYSCLTSKGSPCST
jgi:hypothetical protein